MGSLGPVSRPVLIRKLRSLGFDGPFPGRRHAFMRNGALKVRIPNDHHGADIGVPLLKQVLKQAGVSTADFLAA